MIALLFLKDVDEGVFAEGDRVTTPLDAWEVAAWKFEHDELKKLPPAKRGMAMERREFRVPALAEQSPETQWAYFARASAALAEADGRRG